MSTQCVGGDWIICTSDFTRCCECGSIDTHVQPYAGKCPSCKKHGTHRELPAVLVVAALREHSSLHSERDALRARPTTNEKEG